MALSNLTSGITSAVSSAAGTISKVAGALNNLSNPAALISSIRSMNVPTGSGNAFSATSAIVQFGGPGNADDWRVRLSVPPNFFSSSPVLAPLVNSNGLIFPYTPSIQISSSATYEETGIVHQNYQFTSYQNSRVNEITITGDFFVEDAVQAQYWIAVLHYLRSITKMYTGDTEFQGSPPPIVSLNGYGDYVFKNVPVVIKNFSVTIPQDTNYIATSVGGPGFSAGSAGAGTVAGALGSISGAASSLAGLAGAVGSAKAASTLGKVAGVAGIASGVANLLGGSGSNSLGGFFAAAGSNTHVPAQSSVTVTVQPVYSREATRVFSLQKFVNGDYVNGTGGYI